MEKDKDEFSVMSMS